VKIFHVSASILIRWCSMKGELITQCDAQNTESQVNVMTFNVLSYADLI
jgi:hypothetical protein